MVGETRILGKKENGYRQERDKYGIICGMDAKENEKVENEAVAKVPRMILSADSWVLVG